MGKDIFDDCLLKTCLGVEKIIREHTGIGKPAYGVFFRGLYLAPNITISEYMGHYRLMNELNEIQEVLRELKTKISLVINDNRIHYSNNGIDVIHRIVTFCDDEINKIKIRQQEELVKLVEMHEKIYSEKEK